MSNDTTSLIRASSKNPCPECGKKKYCRMAADGSYVQCMTNSSETPARSAYGGWIHTDVEPKIFPRQFLKTKEEKSIVAPVEKRNRVYRALIKCHPLSRAHKEQLRSRGVPEKNWGNYGTLTKDAGSNSKVWNGVSAEGVAGFFVQKNEWVVNTFFKGDTALLVPTINKHGQIEALQMKTEDKINKYVWFSSSVDWMSLGAMAPMRAHVSLPTEKLTDKIFITEGHWKAEMIAERLGATAISVPGVGQWYLAAEELNNMEVVAVVDAFDMDKFKNRDVKHHRKVFGEEMDKLDYTRFTARWNKAFNGIDDLMMEHGVEGIKFDLDHQSSFRVPFIPIDEAGGRVFDTIGEIIQVDDKRLHVVASTTGVGKSTSAVQLLNEFAHSGKKVAWVSDNYMLLNEIHEGLNAGHSVLKGRQGNLEHEKFFCEKYKECLNAGNAGHNVFKSVCMKCPFFEDKTCSYFTDVHNAMNKNIVLTTKHSLLNGSSRLTKFDILFCDENIHSWLYSNDTYTKSEVYSTLECMLKTKDLEEDNPWVAMMKCLINEMERSDGTFKKPEMQFLDPYFEIDPPDLCQVFRIGTREITPKNFIENLYGASVRINNSELKIVAPNRGLIEMLKDVTVINLDATPIESMLAPLKPVIHNFPVRQNMRVTQVDNVKGSKNQLLDNVEWRQKYIDVIRKLGEGKKTCVFAIKSFVTDYLQPEFTHNEDMLFGYFGRDTRGTNRFKHCNQLIVASDYCVNIGYLEMLSEAISMVNGKASLSDLIDDMAGAEIVQAVGRIRAARRDEMAEVVILTKRPIKGLIVDQKIHMDWLLGIKPGKEAENERRQKVAEFKVKTKIRWHLANGKPIVVEHMSKITGVSAQVIRRVRDATEKEFNDNAVLSTFRHHPNDDNTKSYISDALRLEQNPLTASDIKALLYYSGSDVKATKWRHFVENLEWSMDYNHLSEMTGLSKRIINKYLEIASKLVIHSRKISNALNDRMARLYGDDETFTQIWFLSSANDPELRESLAELSREPEVAMIRINEMILSQQITPELQGFLNQLYERWLDKSS